MMWTLLRKDWRVYRPAVVGGAVLAACPYAVLLLMQVMYPPGGGNTRVTYGRALEQGATAGLLLTLLMSAVFGGMAFAAERRDRSAEFVALLPVRRWPAVLSKLLLVALCLTVLAGVHAWIGAVGTEWRVRMDGRPFLVNDFALEAGFYVSLLVLCFGFAWMLSVYLSSPAVAASVAIGAAAILMFVVDTWFQEHARRHGHGSVASASDVRLAVGALSAAVGSLAVVVATAHYVRRVSP